MSKKKSTKIKGTIKSGVFEDHPALDGGGIVSYDSPVQDTDQVISGCLDHFAGQKFLFVITAKGRAFEKVDDQAWKEVRMPV